jgi:anti-anti-sigma regulatory factor
MRIVGMLARARLEARRRGERLTFSGATEDLRGLVELCGLTDVLDVDPEEPDGP